MEQILAQNQKTWNTLHQKGYQGYTRRPRLNELLCNLPLSLDEKVLLEIGCGKGHWMEAFSPMAREVHGVDISSEAIKLAKARLAHLRNVYFYVTKGDSLEMFEPNKFDLIYSVATFQHIPRKATLAYLMESRRVLKPFGFLVFQVITRWKPELNRGDIGFIEQEETIGYTRAQLEEFVKESGLCLKSIKLQKLMGRARQRCGWFWVVCQK